MNTLQVTFRALAMVLCSSLVVAQSALAVPVPLTNATATVTQGGFPVSNLLANDGAGWATSNLASIAVLQAVTPVVQGPPLGPLFFFDHYDLTINLENFGVPHGDHVLGKFRLSVTDSPNPTTVSGAVWTQLAPTSVVAASSNPALIDGISNIITLTDVNAAFDAVTVLAQTELESITGIRLEVIQDGNGPYPGPGIPGNNNFVLDFVSLDAVEVQVELQVPEPASAALLAIGAWGLVHAARRHRRRGVA